MVDLGLKALVFTEADMYHSYPSPIRVPVENDMEEIEKPSQEEINEYEERQKKSNRQRDAAKSLAFIIIGIPLYVYHWREIKKDKSD